MGEREKQAISVSDVAEVPAEVLTKAIAAPAPIIYSCNGPVIEFGKEEFAALLDALKPKMAEASYEQLTAVDSFTAIGPVVIKGKQLLILRRPENQFSIRAFCGANLSALINEVPEDGEVHEVTCAKCGTVATIRRTPPAEIEAAA